MGSGKILKVIVALSNIVFGMIIMSYNVENTDKKTALNPNEIILMLSGGRDSFLSACYLLDENPDYHLNMVTFDNGCSCQSENARTVADRIIKRYGESRASYLGVYDISSTIREFFLPYFNVQPVELARKYPGLTPSQFHCLICRVSMYINSIWLGYIHNAAVIAEGGREDQEFVIEKPGMAKDRLRKLVEAVGMQHKLPVYDLKDNLIRDHELMHRGFFSKTYEPKCMIGVPVLGSVDETVVKSVEDYFDDMVLPRIQERKLLYFQSDADSAYLENNYAKAQSYLIRANNFNELTK